MIMIFEIDSCNSRKRKFLESIIPSFINQLKLDNSKKSVLVTLQPDCRDSGITTEIPGIGYFIVINSKMTLLQTALTLAHEMIHVYQFAKGILKTNKNGNKIWAGKHFSYKTSYLDMPWEIQAYSRQELILRRALEK